MGDRVYQTIIVLSEDRVALAKAHEKAEELLPSLVSPIIQGRLNVSSFCVLPDGSGIGRDDFQECSRARTVLLEWLEEERQERRSDVEWIAVEFGAGHEPGIMSCGPWYNDYPQYDPADPTAAYFWVKRPGGKGT
jgi:hypothetical protein